MESTGVFFTNDETSKKEENKKLCERYPFLCPRGFNGEYPDGYDYEWTLLDDIPIGWKKAFGVDLCEEIREAALKEPGCLDELRILDIKEKFGVIRIIVFGATKEILDIINKYEKISERTCVSCGKPATRVSLGWVSPWCDDCEDCGTQEKYVSINEWFTEPGDYDKEPRS